MGAFYSSIQVRSRNRDAVKAAVESVASELKKKFLVGIPLGDWVGVYPDNSGQDERCAAALSERLQGTALHLMVHDSDIFFYNLFQDGESLNEYCSDPDYFEEASASEHERLQPKPDLFGAWVDSPEKLGELTQLLERGDRAVRFDFEEYRLEQFANLLGIRNTLTSYEYLTRGDQDGVKGWKEFVHVPDQSGEKAARKEADAALRAEKRRLQKEGLLCFESLPPGKKQQAINSRAEFCFDPLDGGLLVLWRSMIGIPQPPRFVRFQRPFERGPQPVELTFSTSAPANLVMSERGRWLAFYDNKLRLWDWQNRRLIEDINTAGAPILFSHDETLLLCQWQQSFDLVSLETRQVVRSFQTRSHLQALHPSNKFLLTRPTQDKVGLVNLADGELVKVLFSGKKMDWSHLTPVFEGTLKQGGVGQSELDEWKASFVRGSAHILNLKCSPDGRLVFCATTVGLQVLDWVELLRATEVTPEPLFAIMPQPDTAPLVLDHRHYANYIYDVVLDEAQQRLLFCGIEGTIRFLNLNDASTGILLNPPCKSPISRLQLSPDRKLICCLTGPDADNRDKKTWLVQVWDYSALCNLAGLKWSDN